MTRKLAWATAVLMAGNLLLAVATMTIIPISDGHDHRLPYEFWAWIAFGVIAGVQLVAAVALAVRGTRGARALGVIGAIEALPCLALAVAATTIGNAT